jgi:hypothetical protein
MAYQYQLAAPQDDHLLLDVELAGTCTSESSELRQMELDICVKLIQEARISNMENENIESVSVIRR